MISLDALNVLTTDGKCKDIWRYFVEACHRVRSIEPVGQYQVGELETPSTMTYSL